jgi:phage gp46-like protein
MVDLEWPLTAGSGAVGQAPSTRGPATSDVKLFHTADDGEIECINGVVSMSDGVETAVYVSLFGGNEEDSGSAADESIEWWGNKVVSTRAEKLRSETQSLLRALPLTSGNLRAIEDAVAHDLAWMAESEIASFIGAEASIPAVNTVRIKVTLEVQRKEIVLEFVRKVGAQS